MTRTKKRERRREAQIAISTEVDAAQAYPYNEQLS
jgi:hypothetical protein